MLVLETEHTQDPDQGSLFLFVKEKSACQKVYDYLKDHPDVKPWYGLELAELEEELSIEQSEFYLGDIDPYRDDGTDTFVYHDYKNLLIIDFDNCKIYCWKDSLNHVIAK